MIVHNSLLTKLLFNLPIVPAFPSTNNEKSTYINWNRFNDSAKAYLSQGDSVRAIIHRKAIKHEKTVKGYVLVTSPELSTLALS